MLLCSSVPRGFAALAFIRRRFSTGVSRPAFLHRRFSTCLPASGISASTLSCFPMLPHCLPCRVSRGAATLPHRLPLRSIPPPRFACGASASSSYVRAPQPQSFPDGPPASNKPHPAEKSTPVWLAIWRTWAGFANSQHRDAACATPDNIYAHSSLLQH